MKIWNKKILFLLMSSFIVYNIKAYGWGFFAHKLINRQAVFSLPMPIFQFYKENICYITLSAVNPDKRRAILENEAARHFIDLDNYSQSEQEKMPRSWFDAIKKYNEKKLMEHGIVPWHILYMKHRLIKAFKEKNIKTILKISAEAGHYIADANVPLHTTKNYNGQLTNQHGIHGFWESRLPELFAKDYDLFVGKAEKINSLEERAWDAVFVANSYLCEILEKEKTLSEKFKYQKYSYEKRGNVLQRVYSYTFSKEFHDSLNGMVEKQMRKSIKMVADFWYTCWVEAGKPDLSSMNKESNTSLVIQETEMIDNAKTKVTNFRNCD